MKQPVVWQTSLMRSF